MDTARNGGKDVEFLDSRGMDAVRAAASSAAAVCPAQTSLFRTPVSARAAVTEDGRQARVGTHKLPLCFFVFCFCKGWAPTLSRLDGAAP